MQYLGVIGGSGLYAMKDFGLKQKVTVSTPFGEPSGPLCVGELNGVNVIFLARHGEGHVINPSEINYRANIWALKKMGVGAIFSVSAVGSLREEIRPGDMVVVDQFLDFTKRRASTFFENGIVAHVGFGRPVSSYLRELLIESCRDLDLPCHERGTYTCMEGPQFSTMAESHLYRKIGADLIGMTNVQEAKLAREAEIDFSTLALSTDYDCWHPDHDHVTTDQIIRTLHDNIENAQKVIAKAVKKFDFGRKLEAADVLKNAIATDRKKVSAEVVERLKPIIGKYFS